MLLKMPKEGHNWGIKEKMEWVERYKADEEKGERRGWVLEACDGLLKDMSDYIMMMEKLMRPHGMW